MPFALVGAGIGAIGSIFGGNKQANATKQAAQDQLTAANNALQLQQNEFNTVQKNDDPFISAGQIGLRDITTSLPALIKNFNPAANGVSDNFSFDPSTVQNDPGFQFAMQQGQQAIQRSAAARGNLLGGATAKSLDQFATGTAAQYENQDYNQALNTYNTNYSDAFNRFTANQNNAFNKLSGLASIGANVSSGAASAGSNFANQSGEIALGAGNAQAAGAIGSANAGASALGGVSSSLSSLLNNPSFQSMLRNYSGSGGGSSTYGQTSSNNGLGYQDVD